MPHRHDSGTCDLCLEGCMTLALILVIGIYTGVGFLLAQIFIHLTPMGPRTAYFSAYLGLIAFGFVAQSVYAMVHFLRQSGSRNHSDA